MLKDYFEVPNKPAIKSGNVLSCDFTDHETFIPQPLDYTRGTLATYVDCNGLIKISGVSDTELVTNGDFATDSDWALSNSVIENGVLKLNGESGTVRARQNISFTGAAKITYTISFNNTSNTTMQLRDFSGANTQQIPATVGTHTVFKNFATTGITLQTPATVGAEINLDNISVKEVNVETPRIDYLTEIGKAKELQKPSLLLEPQSTNLIEYSQDFTTRSGKWQLFGNATKELNTVISPDGTKNAATIKGLNGAGNNDFRYAFSFDTANKTVVYSVYLKGSGTTRLQVSNGVDQAFNNIITLSGVWQRFSVSGTFNSTSVSTVYLVIDDLGGLTATQYDIWGAQFEEKGYPTSYIPTTGSTVTRNQDLANSAGQLGVFNSEEGALYVDIAALANAGGDRRITISDGTINNRLLIYYYAVADKIAFLFNTGGVLQLFDTQDITATDYNKIALQWKQNDAKIYINGTLAHTDTSINVPSAGTFKQFQFDDLGSNVFFGKVKEVKAFRRALTDSELTELTNNIV